MSGNQRRRTRVNAQFNMQVCIGEADDCCKTKIDLKTRNMSLKGVLSTSDSRLLDGKPCLLVISLSGEAAIKVQATIVRHDEQQAAFDFVRMDAASFYHLRNVIKSISGDPDGVDQEILTIPAFKEFL